MRPSARLKAYLALAAVCFFWGTTYLAIRMALESFPPALLTAARFIISGSVLLAIAKARNAYLPRGRELLTAALSGVLILGIGNGCLAFAELLIPSGLASLFITLSPFWLVGMEALLPGGERLHAPTIFGMLVGFAGVALLVAPETASHGIDKPTLIGFAILQTGIIAWSLGSIYQRRQHAPTHPIVIGAIQQMAAGLAFVPVTLLLRQYSFIWTPRGAAALLYLVVFGSIVGYSAYNYALDKFPVAIVSIYPYFNAIVAVTLGWLFYREPFGPREAIAMIVIFAGVTLVKWHSRRLTGARLQPETT